MQLPWLFLCYRVSCFRRSKIASGQTFYFIFFFVALMCVCISRLHARLEVRLCKCWPFHEMSKVHGDSFNVHSAVMQAHTCIIVPSSPGPYT